MALEEAAEEALEKDDQVMETEEGEQYTKLSHTDMDLSTALRQAITDMELNLKPRLMSSDGSVLFGLSFHLMLLVCVLWRPRAFVGSCRARSCRARSWPD